MTDILSMIEPAAAEAALASSPGQDPKAIDFVNAAASHLSAAISLKRIADALDGTNGISIADAIERAIGTGMFHGFQNMKS